MITFIVWLLWPNELTADMNMSISRFLEGPDYSMLLALDMLVVICIIAINYLLVKTRKSSSRKP